MTNVWAPVGLTYHRLAVDTPALALSYCGLPIESQSRYYVTAEAGPFATPCIGEQCCMCRGISIYGMTYGAEA